MRKALAHQKSSPSSISAYPKCKKISLSYLENSGAYYLGRFPATVAQFRAVMMRKITRSIADHPEQEAAACYQMLDTVVAKFVKLGYLNDHSYGLILVKSLQDQGYSSKRLMGTLRNKGFTPEVIEQIMPRELSHNDLARAIIWVRRKRLGHFALRVRDNAAQKDLAAMARAGFSYADSAQALAMTPDDAERFLRDDGA